MILTKKRRHRKTELSAFRCLCLCAWLVKLISYYSEKTEYHSLCRLCPATAVCEIKVTLIYNKSRKVSSVSLVKTETFSFHTIMREGTVVAFFKMSSSDSPTCSILVMTRGRLFVVTALVQIRRDHVDVESLSIAVRAMLKEKFPLPWER